MLGGVCGIWVSFGRGPSSHLPTGLHGSGADQRNILGVLNVIKEEHVKQPWHIVLSLLSVSGIKSRNSTCYHGSPKQIASVTLLLLNGCNIPQEQIRRGTECILSYGAQEQGLVMTYGDGGQLLEMLSTAQEWGR